MRAEAPPRRPPRAPCAHSPAPSPPSCWRRPGRPSACSTSVPLRRLAMPSRGCPHIGLVSLEIDSKT
eukprot:3190839-Prymnesium_polylepis.1